MKAVAVAVAAAVVFGNASHDQRLIPQGSRLVGRWNVPAAAGVPRQQVVFWQRRGGAAQGLWLWQRSSGDWVRLASLHVQQYAPVKVSRGDVTGDGHLEVLVMEEQGSGACGAKRLLITGPGAVRIAFRSWLCDTFLRFERGLLTRSSGEYTRHDAHCCPTFTRRTEYTWTGRRMKPIRSDKYWNCIERLCLQWRTGPLRFKPRFAAYWDARNGVATGSAKPWLFGRTADGGRSWQIVDASLCKLGRPTLGKRGHALVPFIACDAPSGRFSVARTSDYGRTWTAR